MCDVKLIYFPSHSSLHLLTINILTVPEDPRHRTYTRRATTIVIWWHKNHGRKEWKYKMKLKNVLWRIQLKYITENYGHKNYTSDEWASQKKNYSNRSISRCEMSDEEKKLKMSKFHSFTIHHFFWSSRRPEREIFTSAFRRETLKNNYFPSRLSP